MKRRGYSTDRKPASIHGAVLAHEFGRSGVILRGGARFFGDPFDFARQHRLAAAVAGGARRRSMAVGTMCCCRQYPGRIHYVAHWPQRWRSGAAALRAGASSEANRPLGGSSSHPRGLSSRLAPSADSTPAVCTRLRSARRLAGALSRSLRRSSQPALLLNRMGRYNLRTRDCPPVVWKPPEMVDAAALRVLRTAGGLHLFWNMEASRVAHDRCSKETRAA